ncbi:MULTISPECIES: HlyD family secretion protein [unclassified Bradyrhizobium]|uniref:HlyD family secretion protein n=1 Tax=unclassified Bradyrhizobium TaxID=2631580 RepID=UPI001BADBDA2|nr:MULTISPECIES: HlyD family secretion protein [unclassified Bradyrhizobium]MBR1201455.1 HlyD family secretion protein [Bradyrhizobium sp. AUGA SZCCT0124]MBR1310611.1 HlyD family secretion protein [Bradyrhizobium sp. AUGA SZCCT0051]MBR1340754.1 HlyD family secretion protein [Bradyrhizobium sp. AUGA SZCCT0105]MBR1355360.1 HlyD family secretion protein [Bradyrhizobium sp. AUGA SZCCT0045]
MAAARDQAARIVRSGPEMAADAVARDASADLGEQARTDEAKRADEAKSPGEKGPGDKRPAEAPPASAPEQPAASPAAAAPKSGKRRFVMMGVLGLLALAGASYAAYYLMVGRFYISTDDAYVRANNTMLGARVAGHIAAILPGDNALVRAGDVIFRIDDGDYRIAVDAARTRIATQQATIERIGRQVAAAESSVEQAQAQLVSAEAGLKRADLDFDRQQALSTKGFASRATFEVSEAGRDQGAAAVRSAQAAYAAAKSNVDVTKAQQAEARAQLAELQTQLAKAERDLDFTQVRAPVDGTFSNRLVNTGDYINVGQRLGNVVPLDGVFIDANYKETQLKRIRTGQRVTIKVDAYGFRKFTGIVDSISPAAGSVFTLLPPDNATGNFTKIVQRLPVRIRVPNSVAKQGMLRAGMSVYTTVDTREGAADADADTDLDAPMMIHPQ